MRIHFLSCIMAAGLAVGLCDVAAAQSRGPPAAAQAESIGDIARQEDLSQRAQALAQTLSQRQDGQSAQMLSQARTLLARLQGERLSDSDLNAIEAAIARLESAGR